MGYAQNDTLSPWGAVMQSAQFITAGDAQGKIKFKELAPIGDDTESTVTLQILNDDGTTDFEKSYTWDGSKWVNDSTSEDVSNETIAFGTGFWTYSNSDEPAKIQSSGEVSKSDLNFPLSPWGALGVGNPYPVECTLSQIAPVGDDTESTVTIQILNDDGTTDFEKSYTWDGSKWVNDSTSEDASTVTIGSGVGMWVYSNSDEDASLYIPAPEL